MNKNEMAGYLVSLHNLMEAQMKGQQAVPSTKLVDEYNKYWGMLKEEIGKEDKNEAGKGKSQYDVRDKAGADRSRG